MNSRRLLLELFDAALRAVDGERCVEEFLRHQDADFASASGIVVIAVGKAAASMTLGAHRALGERIRRTLVITKRGHLDPRLQALPALTVLESSHPVPDESSLAAGIALEACVTALGAEELPLFLISGGSSSLVERLVDGATLTELRELNERGLAAGWDIGTLNRERGRLSLLKAGGIARALAGRPAVALFLSDVPGDDPDVIGSGLLGRAQQPDWVRRHVVANVELAMQAVVADAAARGIALARVPGRYNGDAALVAHDFITRLRECGDDGLVWGGEPTVTLPQRPGRGGRNTHLALAAARALRARETLTILVAGTDGSDGPTEDAGAIVDEGTVTRAELGGVDVERAWLDCDSGTALEAAEDLVHTGPTGTNVGDILIGIRQGRGRVRDPASSRVLKA
jgi:glycerate 2-kinase